MPSARHSESVTSSIRRETSSHHSTVSYHLQTTTTNSTSSNPRSITRSRPGSDSSARAIAQRPRHDNRRDRSPRREVSSSARHGHNGVGSRNGSSSTRFDYVGVNSSTQTQVSSSTHHTHRHRQDVQHLANRSQLERSIYDTNNIPDTLVGRQYGWQGSNREDDAQRCIRAVEEILGRNVYEKKG